MNKRFGCRRGGSLADWVVVSAASVSTFTTADLGALSQEYVEAIVQAISEDRAPPLTTTELAAISAQIMPAASRVHGIVSSSKLSFSTCGSDAGAD